MDSPSGLIPARRQPAKPRVLSYPVNIRAESGFERVYRVLEWITLRAEYEIWPRKPRRNQLRSHLFDYDGSNSFVQRGGVLYFPAADI